MTIYNMLRVKKKLEYIYWYQKNHISEEIASNWEALHNDKEMNSSIKHEYPKHDAPSKRASSYTRQKRLEMKE